jgi:ABC-2 type transport system permease protein
MKALNIALKDLKILLRDKRALLILIAMPFIIISILGLALSDTFSPNPSISVFDIAVVDHDGGKVAKLLVDDTLKSKDLKKLFRVKDMKNDGEAKESVSQGDLAAAIIIPKDFSSQLLNGKSSSLQMYGDPGEAIRAGIVQSITTSFARRVSAVSIAVQTPIKILTGEGVIPFQEVGVLVPSLTAKGQQIAKDPQIKIETKKSKAEKSLSAIEYYSAGMAVMFILFGAMFGAFSLLEERRNLTLLRLISTPTGRISILSGKLMGIFLIGAMQFAALIIATRVIFRVTWGGQWLAVAALALATVLAATGMAIFIASVAKTNRSAAAISQIMIQGMAALGGSMIPLMVFPNWMKTLSKFTINYWALDGFTQVMQGKDIHVIVVPCMILLGFACFFMTIGVWRFSYE